MRSRVSRTIRGSGLRSPTSSEVTTVENSPSSSSRQVASSPAIGQQRRHDAARPPVTHQFHHRLGKVVCHEEPSQQAFREHRQAVVGAEFGDKQLLEFDARQVAGLQPVDRSAFRDTRAFDYRRERLQQDTVGGEPGVDGVLGPGREVTAEIEHCGAYRFARLAHATPC